jgi:hypothetical protein
MDILRRYAEYLDSAPERVSELFAEDGYWYDGGMKLFGRDKCAFAGRAEIHANFARPGRPRTAVAGVLINGNAMRYNVNAGGQWVEALAVAQLNDAGLIQSFVIQCIDFRT